MVNLIPTKEFRDEILKEQMKPGQFDVCVTTYEALDRCEKGLLKHQFHYVIFDEAHKLKNSDSQISVKSRKLRSSHRLLLTGTPLQNNIGELWSLLNMLMPDLFGSKSEFEDWFDVSKFEDDAHKLEMVKSLHQIMRPFLLRRTKKDLVQKLPDKIEINISVQLTQLQIAVYSQILAPIQKDLAFTSGGGSLASKKYNNTLMQLLKVCNHPYLIEGVEAEGAEEYGEHLVAASGKLTLLDKLLNKIMPKKEQILIFSRFTSTLNILEDYCDMRRIEFYRLDGKTSLEEREEQI